MRALCVFLSSNLSILFRCVFLVSKIPIFFYYIFFYVFYYFCLIPFLRMMRTKDWVLHSMLLMNQSRVNHFLMYFASVCETSILYVLFLKNQFFQIMVRASTSKKPKTYQVDRLWDRRIEGGQKQYLTSWEGYEDKTWEPVDNLSSKTLLSLMKELDQILDDPTHPKPEWYRKFLQQKQRGIDVMKHGIDYEPPTKRCREATPTAFADAPVPAKTPARFAPSLQSAATTLVARSSPAALRRPTTATSLREAAAARPTAAAPERAASATPHATAASRNGTASPVPSTTRVAARHSFPAPPRVASESDAEADRDSVDVTPSPLVPSTSRAASRSSLAATTQVAAMSSPKVASTSSRTAARYSSPAPSRNKTNTPAPPAVPHTQVAAPVPFTVETPLGAITAVEPDSLLAEYTMENEATRDVSVFSSTVKFLLLSFSVNKINKHIFTGTIEVADQTYHWKSDEWHEKYVEGMSNTRLFEDFL